MPRARSLSWALAAVAVVTVALPWVAAAADPFLEVPPAEVVDRSPAYRYANMGAQAALQELDRRGILYQRVGPHGAVRTPVRLTGKLHGVHIHSALPEHERPTTPFEICDARLALALDDFSELLSRRGIVEVVHFTMYRPSTAYSHARAPADPIVGGSELAKKARSKKNPVRRPSASGTGKRRTAEPPPRASTQSRHPHGLAIDVGMFVKADGTTLSVASHFRGTIGVRTCGPGVPVPEEPRARELRQIVCESYDKKIFTYVLTPNFDQPHQDHLHMDIKPGVRWFLYH